MCYFPPIPNTANGSQTAGLILMPGQRVAAGMAWMTREKTWSETKLNEWFLVWFSRLAEDCLYGLYKVSYAYGFFSVYSGFKIFMLALSVIPGLIYGDKLDEHIYIQ